jgi:hypothetical protein
MLSFGGITQRYLGDQSLRWRAQVKIELSTGELFYLGSGVELGADVDRVHNIHSVSPVAPKIDPITRKSAVSNVTVTVVDDGYLRHLAKTYPLRHAEITVTMQPEAIQADVSAPYWGGYIVDVAPMSGLIEIRCKDAIMMAEFVRTYAPAKNDHPLEHIRSLFENGGVPSATIGSTTFDPDSAANAPIGHLVINNLAGFGVQGDGAAEPPGPDPFTDEWDEWIATLAYSSTNNGYFAQPPLGAGYSENPRETIDELARLCNGSVVADESGILQFLLFDETAAIVDSWGPDDIVSLVQDSANDGIINEIEMTLGIFNKTPVTALYTSTPSGDAVGDIGPDTQHYVLTDTASQARYGGQKFTQRISFKHGVAQMRLTDLNASQTTGLSVGVIPRGGSGLRVDDAFKELAPATTWASVKPFTQPTNAAISAARPMYLKVGAEIIKAAGTHAFSAVADAYKSIDYDDEGIDAGTVTFLPNLLTLVTVTRGALGTTGAAYDPNEHWSNSPVYDVTAPRLVAASLLARAANGIPRLEVKTSLAKYAIQIGDLIGIDSDEVLLFGHDGVSASDVKWEVIGKRPDFLSDSPSITWTLAYATQTSPPTQTLVDNPIEQDLVVGMAWGTAGSFYDAGGTTLLKGVWTIVDYDSEDYDRSAGWDGTNTWTVPQNGIYDLGAQAYIEAVPASSHVQMAFYKNGASARVGPLVYNSTAGALDHIANVFWDGAPLQAGDEITVRAFVSGGSDLTIAGGSTQTWFTIRKVG